MHYISASDLADGDILVKQTVEGQAVFIAENADDTIARLGLTPKIYIATFQVDMVNHTLTTGTIRANTI